MIWLLYLLSAVLAVMVVLLFVAVARTLMLPHKVTDYRLSEDTARVNKYAQKLSLMVQKETISDRQIRQLKNFGNSTSCWKNCFLMCLPSVRKWRLMATCC